MAGRLFIDSVNSNPFDDYKLIYNIDYSGGYVWGTSAVVGFGGFWSVFPGYIGSDDKGFFFDMFLSREVFRKLIGSVYIVRFDDIFGGGDEYLKFVPLFLPEVVVDVGGDEEEEGDGDLFDERGIISGDVYIGEAPSFCDDVEELMEMFLL